MFTVIMIISNKYQVLFNISLTIWVYKSIFLDLFYFLDAMVRLFFMKGTCKKVVIGNKKSSCFKS